jgi:hypothetical protein
MSSAAARPVGRADHLDVFHAREIFANRREANRVRLDEKQAPFLALRVGRGLLDHLVHGLAALDGLGHEAAGARIESASPRFLRRDHVDRSVANGRVVLDARKDTPALDVGQEDVEQDRRRLVLVDHREGGGPLRGHDALHPLLTGRLEQHPREREVILDDEDHLVARVDRLAVVIGFVHHRDRRRLGLGHHGDVGRFLQDRGSGLLHAIAGVARLPRWPHSPPRPRRRLFAATATAGNACGR